MLLVFFTYSLNDVVCSECDVLHTSPPIVPHVLLNLTHPLSRGWFVDGHLDGAIPISDHHRAQAAELCVDLSIDIT